MIFYSEFGFGSVLVQFPTCILSLRRERHDSYHNCSFNSSITVMESPQRILKSGLPPKLKDAYTFISFIRSNEIIAWSNLNFNCIYYHFLFFKHFIPHLLISNSAILCGGVKFDRIFINIKCEMEYEFIIFSYI